jgi:hypothetical protein
MFGSSLSLSGFQFKSSDCRVAMKIVQCLSTIVIALGFTFTSVFAGPVNQELIRRGDNVVLPKPRPGHSTPQRETVLPTKSTAANQDETAVLPGGATDAPKATSGDAQLPLPTQSQVEISTVEKAIAEPSACLQELRKIAEAEATVSPATDDPACTIPDPVILRRTTTDYPIRFTDGLTLDCTFALALARFSSDTTQALAQHHLAAPINKIRSGEGFVCRRRNNARTGKISEHAFGNATDWVGFELTDGSSLSIIDAGLIKPPEAAFLNSLRAAACGTFTTILGPGSNPAHATHFHFDLGRSKGRKNPYRICE